MACILELLSQLKTKETLKVVFCLPAADIPRAELVQLGVLGDPVAEGRVQKFLLNRLVE